MRSFRHLSQSEISEIVTLHGDGVPKPVLAEQFGVDRSTITYHLTKFQRSYPEDGSVYAVIKSQVRKKCAHPSGRCTFCGEMWDELRRVEREQIRALTARLEDAHSRLRIAGLAVE